MAEDLFDGSDLIGVIEDHETFLVSEFLDVSAQDTDAQRMKSADGRSLCLFSFLGSFGFGKEFGNALLHFASGLVREGDCEDLAGRDALSDHVSDSVRDDAGLSCAGSSENQDGPAESEHRVALLGIEGSDTNHQRAECRRTPTRRKLGEGV